MSVAAKVELYISKRPYIREALAEGVINYSALARKITQETGIQNSSAAKAAVSRYEDVVASEKSERKQKVSRILEQTSLSMNSNVEVVNEPEEDSLVHAKTRNGYTSVILGGDKTLITMESPRKLEDTPGVLEYILSALAAKGINVNQVISCREDTHLVIESKSAPESLELLQERIG